MAKKKNRRLAAGVIILIILIIGAVVFEALIKTGYFRNPHQPDAEITKESMETYYKDTSGGEILHAPVIQLDPKQVETNVEKIFVGSSRGVLSAIFPWEESSKKIAWQYQCQGAIVSEPKIRYNDVFDQGDDIIYVTTKAGYVYSIYADTLIPTSPHSGKGSLAAWVFKADSGISGSIATDPRIDSVYFRKDAEQGMDMTYFGTDNGTAYALRDNGNNYTIVWQKHISAAPLLTPVVDPFSPTGTTDDVIYFTATDGNIYAVNCTDGHVMWTYNVGSKLTTTPAISGLLDFYTYDQTFRHRLIIGNATGAVHYINTKTGRANLIQQLHLPYKHPLYRDSSTVDAGTLTTPEIMLSGEKIYIGSSNGVLYVLSRGPDNAGVWDYSVNWTFVSAIDPLTSKPIPILLKPVFYSNSQYVYITRNYEKQAEENGKIVNRPVGELVGIDPHGVARYKQTIITNGSAGSTTASNFPEQVLGRKSYSSLCNQMYIGDSDGVFHSYDIR